MKALDDKDRKLLHALKQNARASLVSLGRDIGLSKSATHDRIIKLEEAGVIQGYTVKINRAVKPGVRAFITLRFAPGFSDGPVTQNIHALPGVEAAYCLAGDVDILVYCECESSEALSDLRNNLAGLEGITEISTRHVLTSSLS